MNKLNENDRDALVSFLLDVSQKKVDNIEEVYMKHYDNLKNILFNLLLQNDILLITFEVCNIKPDEENEEVEKKIRNFIDNASDNMKKVLLETLLFRYMKAVNSDNNNNKEVN